MKTENLKLKNFINGWNFADPKWEKLPESFPDCDISELTTKQDRHLFEAIKTAWIVFGGGRDYFVKQVVRRTILAIVIIFVLFAGGNLIKDIQTDTNTVRAKTVGQVVGNVVEATMSAVFKH